VSGFIGARQEGFSPNIAIRPLFRLAFI